MVNAIVKDEPGSPLADQPTAVPIAVPTAALLLVLASASWWYLAYIYFLNLESAAVEKSGVLRLTALTSAPRCRPASKPNPSS